jgi:hypothetical protein
VTVYTGGVFHAHVVMHAVQFIGSPEVSPS